MPTDDALPPVGIPYAPADVDDNGYHVTCPAEGCGEKFYAPAAATEDEATKDPDALYGAHYLMRHANGQ